MTERRRACEYDATHRIRNNLSGGIRRLRDKLRAKGYKTGKELAAELGISAATVRRRASASRSIDRYPIPTNRRIFTMYRISPETQNSQPTPAMLP